jgi:hypothetical protein
MKPNLRKSGAEFVTEQVAVTSVIYERLDPRQTSTYTDRTLPRDLLRDVPGEVAEPFWRVGHTLRPE